VRVLNTLNAAPVLALFAIRGRHLLTLGSFEEGSKQWPRILWGAVACVQNPTRNFELQARRRAAARAQATAATRFLKPRCRAILGFIRLAILSTKMILKELDPFNSNDKFQLAGRKAEEQLAFYLRRYFKTYTNVFVINGLKIWLDGETAQIDHLIIYPAGIVLVESKSVTGKILVTGDMQWVREYGDKQTGMKSPIIQAKMQGMILCELISKFAKPACYLTENLSALVAISDQGILKRENSGVVDVWKADQICEEVSRLMTENCSPEEEFPSLEELLSGITPNTISVKQVLSRSWLALLCSCFLVECDAWYKEISGVPESEKRMESDALYRKLWEIILERELGEVYLKIRQNYVRRRDELISEHRRTAKAVPVFIPKNLGSRRPM
jgi:hypothetical protein